MAGNVFYEEMPDCPLCMEPFGLDDINFFPCVCRYQVCRFCWHRIRTDENGLCPHCREPYTENPAEYTPPTQEQVLKLKSVKKQKSTEKKQKLMESRKSLADVRVIQKNLVFVVGLSPRLADPETLRKNEYFGKYGRIFKVVINNHTVYNGTQGPSVSAYVTFYRDEDALKAISAVNNAYIDGRYLKASFGTTKYCTTFLRGSQCTKPDCMYLHALGEDEASFTKEDMHMGKHQMYEQSALAAANLDLKEQISEVTVMPNAGGGGGKKVPAAVGGGGSKVAHVTESSESSALPSTASWASSVSKPGEAAVNQAPHLKSHSKSSKQRSTQNHSPKSHTVTSSPRSSFHKQSLKQKHRESSSKSGSPSPNSLTLERTCSDGGRPPQRTDSTSSRDSSSKADTPSLSPKSSLSKSLSSGSLNQDSAFDSPESLSRPTQHLESDYVEALASDGETGLESVGNDVLDDMEENAQTVEEHQMVPEVEPVILPKPVSVLEQELTQEAEKMSLENSQTSVPQLTSAPSVPGGGGVYAVDLPETEYKVVRGREAVGAQTSVDKSDVLDVLSGLGSAGSDHFGSLGVSWNTQVPSTLIGTSTDSVVEESKPVTTPHDDDLGFDPWDVSQQGLADLLETEAEEQQRPQKPISKPTNLPNGVGEHRQHFMASSALPSRSTSKNRHPWQDEFRALFPDVNVSFGGPGFPSTATKAKSDKSTASLHQAVNAATHSNTGYHPTQLANALNYSYQPLQGSTQPATTGTGLSSSAFSTQVSGGGFPSRGFPASSTKVVSNDCGLPGSGRSLDWPSFGDVGTGVDGKSVKEPDTAHTVSAPSLTPHTTYTSSLPSPPPGFVAKPQAFAATTSTNTVRPTVTKVATPTTVASAALGGAVVGGSLSSSVNHALWASSQMQGKGHVVPSHLLQSWNNFLNFSALTPAQQQQLARSSQNYQHLVAQQYLLMQSYMMRGYPMLQAQAQAQAQIQASIRAQLQQHALRQQQQQQQAGLAAVGVNGTPVSIQSSPALPKSVPKTVPTSKPVPTSVVSTISSVQEGTAPTVQASSVTHSASTAGTKGPSQNSKPSNQSGSTKATKHGPTNSSSSSKNHYHHASSKSKTSSSSGSKPVKNSSAGSRTRHKNAGK